MRFPFPLLPATFEIPDEWLAEAGFQAFLRAGDAFQSTGAAILRLPLRYPEHPKDFQGFDRVRMVRILAGIVAGDNIEPVPVFTLPQTDLPVAPFRYRLRDGLHRFYASIAAGFTCLPAFDPDQ
jgi:hypothetical protein